MRRAGADRRAPAHRKTQHRRNHDSMKADPAAGPATRYPRASSFRDLSLKPKWDAKTS